MTVRERIKIALERTGKSQGDLAELLGVRQGSVSGVLNRDSEFDSLKYLEATEKLTGYRFEWLRTGQGPEKDNGTAPDVNEDVSKMVVAKTVSHYLQGKHIRPITVTVDRSGKELISYVPVRALAGYKRGYADAQFIEKLPAFNLPLNVSGSARMFQVDGNSMRQLGGGGLNDGDIVIATYVEDIFSLKDGRVYVIVTDEGVIIKRCINRLLTEDRVLVANSDNKSGEYPPIILHPPEILEVWELKAYISKQLSLATDLWDIINDLQVKQALLADEVKQIKENRLNP